MSPDATWPHKGARPTRRPGTVSLGRKAWHAGRREGKEAGMVPAAKVMLLFLAGMEEEAMRAER